MKKFAFLTLITLCVMSLLASCTSSFVRDQDVLYIQNCAVRTPRVGSDYCTANLSARVCNASDTEQDVLLLATAFQDDRKVADARRYVRLKPGETDIETLALSTLYHPKLYAPSSPNLCKMQLDLYGPKGVLLDRQELPFALKWSEFTLSEGFRFNGVPMKIRGINCSDTARLSDAFESLKDSTINWVRFSGMPPPRDLLERLSQAGILYTITFDNNVCEPLSYQAQEAIARTIRDYERMPGMMAWEIGTIPAGADPETVNLENVRAVTRLVNSTAYRGFALLTIPQHTSAAQFNTLSRYVDVLNVVLPIENMTLYSINAAAADALVRPIIITIERAPDLRMLNTLKDLPCEVNGYLYDL